MPKDAVADTIGTYEVIAEQYFQRHRDLGQVKRIADVYLQHLAGKKILDVGCGPGSGAKYFSEHGFDVVGIDLAENFLAIARKQAPTVRFLKMDMRQLTFEAESFDGIWALASFLHIPKREAKATLRGFWRVLKPQGIINVAVKEGEGEKIEKKDHYATRTKFFAYYTEGELKNLVEEAGFKVFKVINDKIKKATWINVFAQKI